MMSRASKIIGYGKDELISMARDELLDDIDSLWLLALWHKNFMESVE